MLHPSHPLERLQRTRGAAHVALGWRGGRVRLERLSQSGSAKAFLPSVHDPVPEVVFLNTAGGLTGGDRVAFSLDLGAGAAAVATTQTAERAYASGGGRARLDVRLTAGEGARLDWLPQETILYEDAALDRRTEVALAEGASCLFVETLVVGRAAMGERPARLACRDVRLVRRAGRACHAERLALDAGVLAGGARPALLGGARAVATVALVAPGAEDAVSAARSVEATGVEAAASGWDGKCVVRALAEDAWPLRRYTARLLAVLRNGRPLPRVWQI